MNDVTDSKQEKAQRTGRRKRTDLFDIEFIDGLASGWVFDVGEIHRDALDILYVTRIDREKSTNGKKVYRNVWARGVPPVLSFSEGLIFYDPPGVRGMVWSEALKALKRSVEIVSATADQEGQQSAGRIDGKITVRVREYRKSIVYSEKLLNMTQIELEFFLRTGSIPKK